MEGSFPVPAMDVTDFDESGVCGFEFEPGSGLTYDLVKNTRSSTRNIYEIV